MSLVICIWEPGYPVRVGTICFNTIHLIQLIFLYINVLNYFKFCIFYMGKWKFLNYMNSEVLFKNKIFPVNSPQINFEWTKITQVCPKFSINGTFRIEVHTVGSFISEQRAWLFSLKFLTKWYQPFVWITTGNSCTSVYFLCKCHKYVYSVRT